MYDVVIIGAGVCGAATARELSRYKLKVLVLEKEEDVCTGTSKANSAIIHAGYDAANGSLMARLNVRGNEMMEELAEELDFPFKRIGSLVVSRSEEDMPKLRELYERGIKNGVKGLEIIEGKRLTQMEPELSEDVVAALYAPTAGIVCPFGLTFALAENAFVNGVEFQFNTEVTGIVKEQKGFTINTNKGSCRTGYVVNAAGVYADKIHNMVSKNKICITPRKGEYYLLDKCAGKQVKQVIFSLPGKYGKGILVTPTIHGNLLLGPTATDITDKENVATTREGLSEVISKAQLNVKNIPMSQVITSFAGLRAHEKGHEFIIGEAEDAEGFIDCAGIESPGLSSAPAIGELIADILRKKINPEKKEDFVAWRKGILMPESLTGEERKQLIQKHPEYGNIICRCEMVTEGEILDAINRPLGARSLDGIKRRTRAGMGRCQSGFCLPRVMEILARQLETEESELTKMGKESLVIVGRNKDRL